MKKYLFQTAIALGIFFSCQNEEFIEPAVSEKQDQINKEKNNLNTRAATSQAFYKDLAYHHAPIHYQDVDRTGSHGLGGKADYITSVDFDGDLNAKNNWNNITNSAYRGNAYGYYSVTETSTHYFIIYAFFHPRDWTDIFFLYNIDEHENDLEGMLTIVRKNSSSYGEAIGAITVFHSDFYSYKTASSGLSSGQESVDGTITTQYYDGNNRFQTSQEAKGHGMKIYDKQKPGGSDYVVYYPSKTISEYPADIYDRNVKYKLVDIFESGNGLWAQRFNASLFKDAKQFQKSYGNGTANAPWNWDDGNDGNGTGLLAGGMAYYPAELVDAYFNGLGSFSKTYICNHYLGIQ